MLGLPAEELEYGIEEGCQDVTRQRRIVGQKVSNRVGEAHDPVPDRGISMT